MPKSNYMLVTDHPKYLREPVRKRPGIVAGEAVPKENIAGLVDDEIEIGEETQKTVSGVTVECNLKDLQPLLGNFILTNFKIVFKPTD